MDYTVIPLGEIETNCIIVSDRDSQLAAIIDPASDAPRLLRHLQEKGLSLAYILLTHGHWDHIGAVKALHEATGAPVYLHNKDLALPNEITRGNLFATHSYKDGDTITMGKTVFHVYHTPGHTPGSVCLQAGNHLFTGDTLFDRSCGRVDLPLGNWKHMLKSLKRLGQLDEDYGFTPGHGGGGSLHSQRRTNPYVREALG